MNQNQLRMKFGQTNGEGEPPNLQLAPTAPAPVLSTSLGSLYQGDCLAVLPHVADESVDTVFADPPFNLGKKYGAKVNDSLEDAEYINWCKRWIDEAIRTLKPGGSFFLYNIPKWNILLGAHLAGRGLTFRHWIAVSVKFASRSRGGCTRPTTASCTTPRGSPRPSGASGRRS